MGQTPPALSDGLFPPLSSSPSSFTSSSLPLLFPFLFLFSHFPSPLPPPLHLTPLFNLLPTSLSYVSLASLYLSIPIFISA